MTECMAWGLDVLAFAPFSVDRCHAWLPMLDRTEMNMLQISDCMGHVKSSGYMQSSKAWLAESTRV